MLVADRQVTTFEGDLDIDAMKALIDEGQRYRLAVDLETTGLDPKRDKIEVVALAVPSQVAIVLVDSGFPEYLAELLQHRGVEKIFHHALFDVAFLRDEWGIEVGPVACTKVAARLASVERNPRLVDLAWEFLGIELDKSLQVSDWSDRPLSDAQLAYAANDVAYLHPLLEQLTQRLADVGRTRLFQECMQFLPARVELRLMGLDDVFAYEI